MEGREFKWAWKESMDEGKMLGFLGQKNISKDRNVRGVGMMIGEKKNF